MVKKISFCFLLIVLGLLVGCGTNKIPFTQTLRTKYQLTPDELYRLQYYVSDEVVLRRMEVAPSFHEVRGGKLITKSERQIDSVIVKKDTPGILEDYSEDKSRELNISFEECTAFLFSASGGGIYTLKSRDSLGRRRPFFYRETPYFFTNEGDDVHLLIRKEDLDKIIRTKQVLPGRKVRD